MKTETRHVLGQEWHTVESGPVDAPATVLLLPGGLCTAAIYAYVMEALVGAPVRVVAATLPGFGRTPHPQDLTLENYAALASALADDLGADVVGGHSFGANVVLEMAISGQCRGAALLLSPTFSAPDEDKGLQILDRVGRVPGLGPLAWRMALKAIPGSLSDSLPPERRAAVQAILSGNDPTFCRRSVRAYFAYFGRRGDLVAGLRQSGVRAVVAFGDHGETGLTDDERAGLESSERVRLVTIADATHMHVVERPARTAELVLDLVGDRGRA
jgi:pimeloyl-ACP methyl ester carboxylesterase